MMQLRVMKLLSRFFRQYAEAHNNLGIILIEGKQLNKATERFKKAIVSDPNFVEAYNNLGSALMELNDFDLSFENFQQGNFNKS